MKSTECIIVFRIFPVYGTLRSIKKRNGQRGFCMKNQNTRFTLIELLVCNAIIAILASMLLPTLGMAKQRVLNVACIGILKQNGVSLLMYTSDNDDNFMPMLDKTPTIYFGRNMVLP